MQYVGDPCFACSQLPKKKPGSDIAQGFGRMRKFLCLQPDNK